MDLLQNRGCCPRFKFQEFDAARVRLVETAATPEWEVDGEDLRAAAASCVYGKILGTISGENAKKRLGWMYGPLYAVGWNGGTLFCLEGGTVWVGSC